MPPRPKSGPDVPVNWQVGRFTFEIAGSRQCALADGLSDAEELAGLVGIVIDPADRSPDDNMFLSLGISPERMGTDPTSLPITPAEVAAFTPAVAARLVVLLNGGDLVDRLNALFVLRTHLMLPEDQRSPALRNSPGLFAALCSSAGLGLSSAHPFNPSVSHLDSRPLRASAFSGFYHKMFRKMNVLPETATDIACFETGIFLVGALATNTVAIWLDGCMGNLDPAPSDRMAGVEVAGRMGAAAIRAGLGAAAAQYARADVYDFVSRNIDRTAVRTGRAVGLHCLRVLCSLALSACQGLRERDQRQLMSAGASAALEGLIRRPLDTIVRGYAAQLLSFSCSDPAMKVAADEATYGLHSRARAIAAAGNLSYASSHMKQVAPLLAIIGGVLKRVVADPLVLLHPSDDEPDQAAAWAAHSQRLLFYHVSFACMQLVQYRDFRPWFDSMGGVAFFTAARETARKYPEDCSDAEAQLTVVLSRLARAPPAFLSGDPERMEVTTTPQGSKQLSTVYKGSEIVERPPAACAAAGCSASGPALKQCSACRAVSYCCQECQKKGWKEGHKQECKALAAAAAVAKAAVKAGDWASLERAARSAAAARGSSSSR